MGGFVKLFISHFPKLYTQELEYLQRYLHFVNHELAHGPENALHVHNRDGKYSFSIYGPDDHSSASSGRMTERYVTRDSALPADLVSKYCAKRLKPVLEASIRQLKSDPAAYDPDQLIRLQRKLANIFGDCLPKAYQDPQTIISTWEQETFTPNSFHTEGETLFRTRRGEMVRSKNECLCANLLYELDIPYKYEAPVKLADGHVVYPDFDMISPVNGSEYYLEIFGMMGDPVYAAKAFRKINKYAASGIVLNDNLLVIFEYEGIPFNTALLESMLRRIVLNLKS